MTGNQTIISEFLLLGLPIQPEMKVPLYTVFLAMYLITVLGNLIIIFLILVDSHLHTPMYLFLSNLSFSDMCFSSVTIPKMLINMQNKKPAISYTGCLTQMYFFFFFGDLESFLLVAMAFDRYVAICDPLHYTVIMNPKLCITFSSNNIISHFFCDLSALLKLASSDVHINELMIFIFGGLVLVVPFLLIVASYARILSSILRVPSVRGIRKAFSTCGSHLSVVSLFYGTIIGLYLCPSSNNSTVKEIVMSIMYTVVTPMLNPFIYSLRNQDIKGAIKKLLTGRKLPFPG
uniref:Olfactory receptor n=1 Tax=Monodelphis domestica TaxID=13616 RepID=A0A5F8GDR8_MONDO